MSKRPKQLDATDRPDQSDRPSDAPQQSPDAVRERKDGPISRYTKRTKAAVQASLDGSSHEHAGKALGHAKALTGEVLDGISKPFPSAKRSFNKAAHFTGMISETGVAVVKSFQENIFREEKAPKKRQRRKDLRSGYRSISQSDS